jgi:hypothetical protein
VGKKGTLIHCWWECKLEQPPWNSVWRFLKKLKIELPCNPVIPVLDIHPKECKSAYNGDTCTVMLTAALFAISAGTQDEWTVWDIHTIEFYSARKKNEIMLFAGKWTELEIITLSKINQTEKDKYHMFSLTKR